jgi:hypothetical protein
MQIFSLRECPIPAGISPSPGLLVSVPLTKGEFAVFLRIDRLQIELPLPRSRHPMLRRCRSYYVFQSFNLRSKSAQHCSCSIACSNAGRGWRCFGRRSRGPDAPAPLIASDYGGALVRLLLVTGPDAWASGPSHGYSQMGWPPPGLSQVLGAMGRNRPAGRAFFYPSVFYSCRSEPHWENGTEAN